jgi:hypothetical protein
MSIMECFSHQKKRGGEIYKSYPSHVFLWNTTLKYLLKKNLISDAHAMLDEKSDEIMEGE